MTKKEALDLLMLLSAMESWAMAHRQDFAEYLQHDLSVQVDLLRKIVLGEPNE